MWGYSSAGRAPALHAGGQRFDPAYLHHSYKKLANKKTKYKFYEEIKFIFGFKRTKSVTIVTMLFKNLMLKSLIFFV